LYFKWKKRELTVRTGKKLKKTVIPTIILLVFASAICLLIAKEYSKTKRANNPYLNKIEQAESGSGSSDSSVPVVSSERLTAEDTCLVISKNLEEKQITFRNIKGGEDKVLKYDGKTKFLSKHEGPLTAAEMMPGDIVDVTFTTYDSVLTKVQQSTKAWENRNVSKFSIDEKGKTITIGDDIYKMASNSVITSGESIGKLLDVTGLDEVTVKGIDKDVYSVQIEKGHGYIRVKNDSYFVGGWVEVGQDIITILTESMLIPCPEGTYDIKVTNKGYVGRETVEVKRDKETILDLSKVEIEEVAIGHVLFSINPDFAQLFVDGIMTDFEERVPLEYGIHSVRVELAGYETVRANIRVASEMANISIELDESAENDSENSMEGVPRGPESSINNSESPADNITSDSSETSYVDTTASQSTDSTSTVDSVISDNKQIYVEGPTGAEVYLDGSYIGIAPCNTQKVTGNHTITLSKSGYETKSYTINVGNDGKDLTMSFSELNAIQ